MALEPKLIRDLRAAKPHKRVQLLKRRHQRNVTFLEGHFPELARHVARIGIGRFKVEADGGFVSVIDGSTGGLLHPSGELAQFSRRLGGIRHGGWWEYQSLLTGRRGAHEHDRRVSAWLDGLAAGVPGPPDTLPEGGPDLPRMSGGRPFSPLTLFLGLNTGLHVACYLDAVDVQDIVLVEPDPERFALSCLFMDYAALHRRFGHLHLVVGDCDPGQVLSSIAAEFPITTQAWVRMLRAYDNPLFRRFAELAGLHFRRNVYLPFDRELRALGWQVDNLEAGRAIWSRPPALSPQARIAVVGAGPSLDTQLSWLRTWRDRLIVIAVVSAVRPLRAAGIRPDFQCVLDYEHTSATLDRLELDAEVPLIASSKADPGMLSRCREALLFVDTDVPNVARFDACWRHTAPTSGNLALVAALQFRPSAVYLLGMDLAFPRKARSHAEGTLHGHRAAGEDFAAPVSDTNRPDEAGEWVTTPYLVNARQAAERALAETDIPVINLSGGARIQGATPGRAEEVEPSPCPERAEDLRRIRETFHARIPCERYEVSPEACLDALAAPLEDLGRMLEPDRFTGVLDTYWRQVMVQVAIRDPADRRPEIFHHFLRQLLVGWYRCLLLAPEGSAQTLYGTGLATLRHLLAELRWPRRVTEFMAPGGYEAAEVRCLDRYAADAGARDCLARIGGALADEGDWEAAAACMEKDRQAGRLSPVWLLNLAGILGRLDRFDEARECVREAYSQDPFLKNGHARLGRIHAGRRAWAAACDLFALDRDSGRLTPDGLIEFALLAARAGSMAAPEPLVQEAYEAGRALSDGHARMGWLRLGQGDPRAALALMARDDTLGRMSPAWRLKYAAILWCRSERASALAQIGQAYEASPGLRDGGASVAWTALALDADLTRGDLDTLMALDEAGGRLTRVGEKVRAWYEGVHGDAQKARRMVLDHYAADRQARDDLSGIGWLLIRHGRPEEGVGLMRADFDLGRMSTFWQLAYVRVLARSGERHKAEELFAELRGRIGDCQEYYLGFQFCPDETIGAGEIGRLTAG